MPAKHFKVKGLGDFPAIDEVFNKVGMPLAPEDYKVLEALRAIKPTMTRAIDSYTNYINKASTLIEALTALKTANPKNKKMIAKIDDDIKWAEDRRLKARNTLKVLVAVFETIPFGAR